MRGGHRLSRSDGAVVQVNPSRGGEISQAQVPPRQRHCRPQN
jgi:hypothetical protein